MIKDVKIPIETTELINQISDNARENFYRYNGICKHWTNTDF